MSRYVAPKTVLAVTDKQTTALVASAIGRSASLNRKIRRKHDSRQDRAWDHYDKCGELRYATNWFANALSRATLKVVKIGSDGEPSDVTSGPAYDALKRLLDGAGGAAPLLKSMGQQYFVPGEWYLVGRKPTKDEESLVPKGEMLFEVASTSEIEKTGKDWFLLREGGEKIPLDDKEPIIRMWQPHPKKKNEPDSPVLGNDAIITQIEVLTRHTAAQVFSRLAGAGLLILPSEFTFATPADGSVPDGVDPFLAMLGDIMAAAIEDPGSPEAMVPVLVKVPGEFIEKVQHLTFWSELDAQTVPQTEAGIRRLALGLDLPPEVLTGTADVNHWGAWQIDESAIKAHIEPALTIICAFLTMDYLRYFAPGLHDHYITFDTAALRLRPNRSKEAVELYDRGEISGVALRRETGFEEQDAMTEEDRKIWLLMKVASGSATPEMVAQALRLLNVAFPEPTQDVPTNEARPDPSLQDHPVTGPPEREEDQAAALYAMCDALVYRAMERAGNRLNNGSKVRPPGADPSETHLFVKAPNNRLDSLLADAWNPLPRFLERLKYHPDIIAGCLDSYCRTLLIEQRPHTSEEMQRFIQSGMSMTP